MKQGISVVIMDLDNTLYDWVDIWYKSFKAMLDRLVQDSGISEETLINEFKEVHERHQTAEYAFSIEELPSLKSKYPGQDLVGVFQGAIDDYRAARKAALRLYPTVMETLETLKDKGCLLVGYTESMSFYTNYRMRNLGLDRIIDYLRTPPDHELPAGLTPGQIRSNPDEYYQLKRTVHRDLAKGSIKPNPRVLLEIIGDVGAGLEETIYVGDSLMKDVQMAQKAGVTDVWAKYGVAQNRSEYELLRKVTHWTAEDVAREKRLYVGEVKPAYVLENQFSELLDGFEFVKFEDKSAGTSTSA